MRISNEMILRLQKVLFLSLGVISIVTLLELVFIGKNLTFTTKFTPMESEENRLRNETYITQAQTLIFFLCILYTSLLPSATYSSFKQTQKAFFPVLITTIAINGLLIFLNIYFLTGATYYRNYMNQQYHEFQNTGTCLNSKNSLCTVGKCVRLQVFEQARSMSIAFTVINSLFSIVYTFILILVNKKRKDPHKMQLIV